MGRQLDGLWMAAWIPWLQNSVQHWPLHDAPTSNLGINPHSDFVGQEEARPCTCTLTSGRKTQMLTKVTGKDWNAKRFSDEQRVPEGIYTEATVKHCGRDNFYKQQTIFMQIPPHYSFWAFHSHCGAKYKCSPSLHRLFSCDNRKAL